MQLQHYKTDNYRQFVLWSAKRQKTLLGFYYGKWFIRIGYNVPSAGSYQIKIGKSTK